MDAIFYLGLASAQCLIAARYGWLGFGLSVVSPALLATLLWSAHEFEWIALVDNEQMLRFALNWFVFGIMGGGIGLVMHRSDRKSGQR